MGVCFEFLELYGKKQSAGEVRRWLKKSKIFDESKTIKILCAVRGENIRKTFDAAHPSPKFPLPPVCGAKIRAKHENKESKRDRELGESRGDWSRAVTENQSVAEAGGDRDRESETFADSLMAISLLQAWPLFTLTNCWPRDSLISPGDASPVQPATFSYVPLPPFLSFSFSLSLSSGTG